LGVEKLAFPEFSIGKQHLHFFFGVAELLAGKNNIVLLLS
jgi:hypothetical protein